MNTKNIHASAARKGLRMQLEKKRAEMHTEKNRAEFLRLWGEEAELRLALKKASRRAWSRWLRNGGLLPEDAGRLGDALTATELWRVGKPVNVPGCAGTFLDLPNGERISAPPLGDLWESARRSALA